MSCDEGPEEPVYEEGGNDADDEGEGAGVGDGYDGG